MKIPVRNLYYMLCYAWDHLAEGTLVDVASEDIPADLPELLARVLASGVRQLSHRGIDRNYVTISEELPGVRGRLNVGSTVGRALRRKAHAACEFDELSHDVLQNQIIKATIRKLLSSAPLPAALDDELRAAADCFRNVSDIRPTRGAFSRVQLHRNNRFYAFLLSVCRLLFDRVIPNSREGSYRFRAFEEDQVAMRALFERFVFQFLRREQARYDVSSPRVNWRGFSAAPGVAQLVPKMFTDVVLDRPGHTIVIDTKFTPKALQVRFDRHTLRSAHLYQLLAYLSNIERPGSRIDGVLLYPAIRSDLCVDFAVDGHSIRAATVDLDQPWPAIHAQLLRLTLDQPASMVTGPLSA